MIRNTHRELLVLLNMPKKPFTKSLLSDSLLGDGYPPPVHHGRCCNHSEGYCDGEPQRGGMGIGEDGGRQ